jgi:hypothetical protein
MNQNTASQRTQFLVQETLCCIPTTTEIKTQINKDCTICNDGTNYQNKNSLCTITKDVKGNMSQSQYMKLMSSECILNDVSFALQTQNTPLPSST